MRKRRIRFFSFLLVCLFLTGCKKEAPPKEAHEFLMGTYVQVKVYDDDKEKVVGQVMDRVHELTEELSVEESDAELFKVNQAAGREPVVVSKDVYTVVKEAKRYSDELQGFDLTIGPLTQLWHIGFPDAKKPTQEAIDQAVGLIDATQIVCDDKERSVFLKEPGMRLDLGGIAKGYITDEVVELLKKQGVNQAIVNIGGNVYVLGNPKEKNWSVGIRAPEKDSKAVIGTLAASSQSVVTSGIYERVLEENGQTYSHLLDPETGYPVENDLASVTIVSKQSVAGDALSTAVFLMGSQRGKAYVESLPDIEAIFITKDKKIAVTTGLKERFTLNDSSYKQEND